MRVLILILTFFLALFWVRPVLAVTVTISNVPSSVDDQRFSFNASVSGGQTGTNYLRTNFYPSGTTNYFGYTYNGSSYTNSSTCSDYLPITIDSSGNWNGTVQAKIDTSSSYYTGNGSYSFKVRRYTASCSSSYTWSNEVTTNVSIPTPTPTPSPTPTPTPSPSPSPTSNASSSTFTVSNVPSEINSDKSFAPSVNISLPSNPNSKFYLKRSF